MRLETLDTWSLSGAAASADPGRPSGEVASVTVTPDDTWVLDDDRFYFLVDSSYGLQPDFAASFARNTLFRLPPGKAVQLGSDIVTADGEGGEVTVRNGKIVDKRRVRVGAAGAPR